MLKQILVLFLPFLMSDVGKCQVCDQAEFCASSKKIILIIYCLLVGHYVLLAVSVRK